MFILIKKDSTLYQIEVMNRLSDLLKVQFDESLANVEKFVAQALCGHVLVDCLNDCIKVLKILL